MSEQQHLTENANETIPTNTYWKSLGELARNKEYETYLHREFGDNASELTDNVSRRSFLRVMGASIAMAGFAACRRPVQKILPYSRQPENVVIGIPLQYASAFPFQDALSGVIIENNEGRPSKIEGNPDHPGSRGKSSLYQQAAILSMYDPDRSRNIRKAGQPATKEEFVAWVKESFANRSQNILFISEESSSPTYNRLKADALTQFPNATWVTYEAFGDANVLDGTELAFGRALRVVNHFDKADVVVSLDDDFMSPQGHKNAIANAGQVTGKRKVATTEDTLSRIYVAESTFSTTGSYADHRFKVKASEIEDLTFALAATLQRTLNSAALRPFAGVNNRFLTEAFVEQMAEDLLAARGSNGGSGSIVTAGQYHSAETHAAVAAINIALGNAGTSTTSTVTYHEVPHVDGSQKRDAFRSAVSRLNSGAFQTVVLVGTNPAFTAPKEFNFTQALAKASNLVHLSDYVDETSKAVEAAGGWHVNRAHFLEAWGDGRAYTGEPGVIQPQIQPLHGGWSEIELLGTLLTGEASNGYTQVQQTWAAGRSLTGNAFKTQWETVLHDGVDKSQQSYRAVNASLTSGFNSALSQAASTSRVQKDALSNGKGEIELVIKPDSKLYDGRFANNGWLMELPDPMTKITWDNVALISPATAQALGIPLERHLSDQSAPIVRLTVNGSTVEIPAWIQPGHADGTTTVTVGYGRQGVGRVADGSGVDTYPLLTAGVTTNAGFTTGGYITSATIEVTDRDYEIACTQAHHSLEGRDMVRTATIDQYKEYPDFATYKTVHGYEVPGIKEALAEGDEKGPISLFNETYGPDYEPQWGMAIDLNSCFGCGVCTIACQAENNIPVVGKKEVGRRRIMHWIRTDRYFEGDTENPKVYHQPVPCMHCELAPCEQVCPVAATTHSDDGMNQMTYNRCIGTRYCANNCPFKVRRFNFFNYAKEYLTTGDDPEIIQMAMNPEVTIRFRGVMEKCTYCVQRVNRAKIATKRETGSPRPADGTVLTACQQACPADAITFGDLTDANAVVTQNKRNDRNYVMLEELNVRPRTSYLAKLYNTNTNLETPKPVGKGK